MRSIFLATLICGWAISVAHALPSDIEAMATGETEVYQSGRGIFSERIVTLAFPKEWRAIVRRPNLVSLESPHRDGTPRIFLTLSPGARPPTARDPEALDSAEARRFIPKDTPEVGFSTTDMSFTVIHGLPCLVVRYEAAGVGSPLQARGVAYVLVTHGKALTFDAALTREPDWNESVWDKAWRHYANLADIIAHTIEVKDLPNGPSLANESAKPVPTPQLVGTTEPVAPWRMALYVFVGFVLVVLALYGAYRMRSWED